MSVHVLADPDQVAEAAAGSFVQRAARASAAGRWFNVALSGGSTPQRTFRLLAERPYSRQVAWNNVHIFWGDERTVPPDHHDSNFGAANESLLSRVEIPLENIHRIEAERPDPRAAAAAYEAELRSHFGLAEGELPRFDLVFLGMGADGHTASLFPGTEALDQLERLAVAPRVEKLGAHRVTLTCPVFNNAACILFLVTGEDKAATVRDVVQDLPGATRYPASLIRPVNGELIWLIDKAAGRLLRSQTLEAAGGPE